MNELKLHLMLSIVAVTLLWCSSLTACKVLARYLFSNVDEFAPFDLKLERRLFASSLDEESDRYRQCIKRQFTECNTQMYLALEQERLRLDKLIENSLVNLSLSLQELDNCAMEIVEECERQANVTGWTNSQEQAAKESKLKLQLRRIERSIETNHAQQDAFWAAVECTKVGGNCPTKSFGQYFQDALVTYREQYEYNVARAAQFNAQVQARLNQLENFVESVRAISDHLAAIGIQLGIPGRSPPFYSLVIAGLPNFPSVTEMFYNAMSKSLEKVKKAEQDAEDALVEIKETHEQELEILQSNLSQARRDASNMMGNVSRSVLDSLSSSLRYPGQVLYSTANTTAVMEELEVFEQAWDQLSDLGGLAVTCDTIYRAYRSMVIFHRAFSSTRMNKMAYDATLVLDGRYKPHQLNSNFTRINRIFSSSGFDSSWLVYLLLGGILFDLLMRGIYTPLLVDFQKGCSDLFKPESNSSTNSLISNAQSLAFTWASADGKTEHQYHALHIQTQAMEICFNESFALDEQRYKQEKTFRDRFDQVWDMTHCVPNESSSSSTIEHERCETRISFKSSLVNSNSGNDEDEDRKGTFHCNLLLDNCELTCQGPAKSMVDAATKRYVCALQSTFQSKFGIMLLALIIFICVNVSRLLTIAGLLKLSNSMRLNMMAVRGRNSRSNNKEPMGNYLPILWRYRVDSGTLATLDDNQLLREYLERETKEDKFAGWILMILAALFQVLWMIIAKERF